MAKKKLRLGNALLCDYVGRGERNKHTLVNVYSGNVMFDALPADFGFGLYIEIEDEQPSGSPKEIEVSLRFDGEEFLHVKSPAKPGRGTMLLQMVQVRVEKNTTLDVVVSAPGYAETVALSKRFYAKEAVVTSPTVSQQPSARSQRGAPAS